MIIKAIPGLLDYYRTTTTTTSTSTTTTAPPAAGIQGFGALATGANTATIYHVTTLTGTGSGSLSYGLGLPSGSGAPSPNGKTIVFDVAGIINMSHTVTSGSYFTIDGTTAPYPGISITSGSGGGLIFEGTGAHHIIVKSITTFSCGNESDGIACDNGSNNIAILNCTSYGNTDGNIDVSTDSQYVTIAYCIIGNNRGFQFENSGGTLITGRNVTWHHNLTNYGVDNAGNDGERAPFVHRNYGTAGNPDADIRNNLVWNYGRNNATGSGFGTGIGYNAKANVVNNYYYTINNASDNLAINNNVDNTPNPGQVYSAGNVSGNGTNLNGAGYNNHTEFPIPVQYQITSQLACDSALEVLAYAGMTQRNPVGGGRNPIDQSYVANINLTGCASGTTTTSTSTSTTTSTTTTSTTTIPGGRQNLIFEALFGGTLPSSAPTIGTFPDIAQSCCEVNSGCCSYAATTSTSHPRTGTKSFRAEVRASDPAVHGGWRSEVVPQYTGGLIDSGDRWYGFSLYFDTPQSAGNWLGSYGGHFIQWHPDNGTGSLSLGLWGSDGLWDLTVNWQGDETADHYYFGGTTPNGGTPVQILANVWWDIVMNVNWTTGLTRWWRNGVLQNSLTIPWSSGPGRYLKFGMNRWGNGPGGAPQNTWIIYYANLRVGNASATFNDVAP